MLSFVPVGKLDNLVIGLTYLLALLYPKIQRRRKKKKRK
jgi:hypothetical protein